METIEKLKWLPVWLIMFSLIFTTGAFYYKQSLLTHAGDEVLKEAANNGRFTTEQVEGLIDKLDRYGFDRSKLQVEISPAEALNSGVSKDSSEYIKLKIDSNTTAFISNVLNFLSTDNKAIEYYYVRKAKSEEYIE